MQRGIGNGSCGPGTESQYHCPAYKTVTHTMRISTINGAETGISEIGVKKSAVGYDADLESITCTNLPTGATVTVVNFGGMLVGEAMAVAGTATVSLAGQPQAAYIVVIKCGDEVRTHRFIKW